VKKNKNNRRTSALQRLEKQLKVGNKRVKNNVVILTDKNVKRINKEIDKLKNKIKHHES
jgi:coenzyme F420-reducing hydrogenase delta subunit